MAFSHILEFSRSANVSRLAETAIQASAIAKMAIRGRDIAYTAKDTCVARLLSLGEAHMGNRDPKVPGFRTVYIPAGGGKWRRVHYRS